MKFYTNYSSQTIYNPETEVADKGAMGSAAAPFIPNVNNVCEEKGSVCYESMSFDKLNNLIREIMIRYFHDQKMTARKEKIASREHTKRYVAQIQSSLKSTVGITLNAVSAVFAGFGAGFAGVSLVNNAAGSIVKSLELLMSATGGCERIHSSINGAEIERRRFLKELSDKKGDDDSQCVSDCSNKEQQYLREVSEKESEHSSRVNAVLHQ